MCQFCVQHGEGKRWYLQAQNYAADLTSDLARRGYMLDFIRDFDRHRAQAIAGLELLNTMPRPIREPIKRKVRRGFLDQHFGQPVPLEECEHIFDFATEIVRMPCVCRRFAGTAQGDGWCMAVTTRPVDDLLLEGFGSYEDGPDAADFQHLTKAEAMRMLRDAEEQGLMHSVWTFMTPFIAAICNCNLSSGCMAMRITRELDTKIMWKGEWVASVDRQACTGCRRCEKRCPFGAVLWDRASKRAEVDASACWGCGVCRSACEKEAIGLAERSAVPLVANDW
ncbi:MAG TPA: 4Fe-4S dicluster domain-containing protein [Coriobacteriia bacterium]|jgi:Pyruvate/2-oxoacid:ferredoxin oxidoreductase delta subunit